MAKKPKFYNMQNESIALQAKVFLYHLNNANNENGFRTKESWKFSQVSEQGKAKIEHDFFPTVSVQVDPKKIHDFAASVLLQLKEQPKINVPDLNVSIQTGSEYFIAFSPDRMIR